MLYNDENGKFYPSTKTEEHYSVTKEPSGEYAFQFTPEQATDATPHAKQIAIRIVRWLAENNALDTLIAIGGDSTYVNTVGKLVSSHGLRNSLVDHSSGLSVDFTSMSYH